MRVFAQCRTQGARPACLRLLQIFASAKSIIFKMKPAFRSFAPRSTEAMLNPQVHRRLSKPESFPCGQRSRSLGGYCNESAGPARHTQNLVSIFNLCLKFWSRREKLTVYWQGSCDGAFCGTSLCHAIFRKLWQRDCIRLWSDEPDARCRAV